MPSTLSSSHWAIFFTTALIFTSIKNVHAAGMVPETSIIIIYEEQGEATIRVRNTDTQAALLLTSINTIQEESDVLLVATPPVSRLEPDETQLVRFILQTTEPLKEQRLQRVVFEGMQPKNTASGMRLNMNLRQNLPVIIHPKGMVLERQPWTLLQWSIRDQQLHVENPSPYVVRLGQSVELLPTAGSVRLNNSYVLPGQKFSFPLDAKQAATIKEVRLSPATVYGYSVATYIAPLNKQI